MTQVGPNQEFTSTKTESVVDNLIELGSEEDSNNSDNNVVVKGTNTTDLPPLPPMTHLESCPEQTDTFDNHGDDEPTKTTTEDNPTSNICVECDRLKGNLEEKVKENAKLEQRCDELNKRLEITKKDLEHEIQRRCDLEQKFTEESKRSTEQIEELINKSDHDDTKLNELRRKFEQYTRETSTMIENFTTNREILTSHLLELRKENDYLLGKYLGKSRDLQSEDINLPQNVDDLQFHCLMLNEKLILATLAKERLEETMIHNATSPADESPTRTP